MSLKHTKKIHLFPCGMQALTLWLDCMSNRRLSRYRVYWVSRWIKDTPQCHKWNAGYVHKLSTLSVRTMRTLRVKTEPKASIVIMKLTGEPLNVERRMG